MTIEKTNPQVAEIRLDQSAYLRARISPSPADPIYLHFVDLYRALAKNATKDAITVLDYGAGGSPYRSLFPNSTYHRADFLYSNGLDFRVAADSTIVDIADETYDLVLSTQVLEHVQNPEVYLREAFRVLKPGGTLLITTHGTFPDHGCPYDYWRWTNDGLRRAMESAGFRVDQQYRLTSGPRAVFFMLVQLGNTYWDPSHKLLKIAVRILRKIFRLSQGTINKAIDRLTLPYSTRTEPAESCVDFSIGLFASGKKG